MEFSRIPTNLQLVLEESIQLATRPDRMHSVDIFYHLDPAVPSEVQSDPR